MALRLLMPSLPTGTVTFLSYRNLPTSKATSRLHRYILTLGQTRARVIAWSFWCCTTLVPTATSTDLIRRLADHEEEQRMKIAIVGAGGLGSYLGAQLARADRDVTFIARGEH